MYGQIIYLSCPRVNGLPLPSVAALAAPRIVDDGDVLQGATIAVSSPTGAMPHVRDPVRSADRGVGERIHDLTRLHVDLRHAPCARRRGVKGGVHVLAVVGGDSEI